MKPYRTSEKELTSITKWQMKRMLVEAEILIDKNYGWCKNKKHKLLSGNWGCPRCLTCGKKVML